MDIMNQVKGWAKGLADVGVSLIALGIVLEILFKGQGIPFWPNISVIGNVQGVLKGFSDQGLIGLVAVLKRLSYVAIACWATIPPIECPIK